jgi:hypothetical protein
VIAYHTSAFSVTHYPLKNSALLDSGATIHIFNNCNRFDKYRPAEPDDFVFAGKQQIPIQGYGNVDLHAQGPEGSRMIRLCDVALCEGFPCNLVSLRQLHKRGYWWDNKPPSNCIRTRNGTVVCNVIIRHEQFIIEDVTLEKATFVT